jgi:hypothetical protein
MRREVTVTSMSREVRVTPTTVPSMRTTCVTGFLRFASSPRASPDLKLIRATAYHSPASNLSLTTAAHLYSGIPVHFTQKFKTCGDSNFSTYGNRSTISKHPTVIPTLITPLLPTLITPLLIPKLIIQT